MILVILPFVRTVCCDAMINKAVLMGRVGKADYSEVPKLYRK